MMFRRIAIVFLTSAGVLAGADKPNRDVQELQRDVAQLQEMIKTLQQSFEQRTAAMTTQIQNIGSAVEKISGSMAALQKATGEVAPLIATQGGRIDHTTESLNTVQQAVADLTASVNKLRTEVGDVSIAVKVLSAPPAGPPGSDKPPVTAADLINNARGDQSGGKPQLALQEYGDYLKWYGDTPTAHEAQFQIGYLHYQLQDYESAVKDFDALAQKFPESTKLPDALFYKRKSLQGLGRNADAAAVCQELRKRFPANDLAKQCVTARR